MSQSDVHAVRLPLLVGAALLMENIDSTVIATALPQMARDFGHDPVALKIGLTTYVLGLGIFIPLSGWLADRYGARRIFRSAIWIFSIGSLLCAVSPSLRPFIGARFLQGLGGALMVPVGRIVVFRTVPKADFVRAVSYITIPALLGPVIGPPVGGFITTYLHWRWIFLINLPVAALGLWLTSLYMPALSGESEEPMDWPGFALVGIGASLLMLGPSLLDTPYASDREALYLTVAGIAVLLGYGTYARAFPRPILDLRLLAIPTFRASVLGGSLFRVALGSIPFLLPLALQEGLGFSPFVSGTLTAFSAGGSLIMKWLATRALRAWGFRNVLVYNAIIVAGVIVCYGLFAPGTPHALIALTILVAGIFPSLQFTSINAIAYADIPAPDVARATSLASTVQQISLGMGISIGGVVLHAVSVWSKHPTLSYLDFRPTFAVMALFSIASIPFNLRLARDAASELARPGGGAEAAH